MKFINNKGILIVLLLSLIGCNGEDVDLLPTSDNPVIKSFLPVSGREGTQVVIDGYNFSSDRNKVKVFLGDISITLVSANFTQLSFVVPVGIPPGEYQIKVQVDSLTASSSDYFEVKEENNIIDSEVMNFNYSIGTQTIGPSYGFTEEDILVETSKAILEMGSNILKIALATSKYADIVQYPSATAVELVRDHPSFKTVMDMPFTYYFFWANNSKVWKDGYSAAERLSDSTQIADLTTYLLTNYNNTAKQFYLGNWEGDWMLLGSGNVTAIPTDEQIQGMIQWYECRQNAIEEAKRITAHNNVNVYSYCEVNRVVDAMEGKARVVNKVLPYTYVDYVSYSSYDSQKLPQEEYSAVLDYIETNLPPKPQLAGKRVFIGEMGIKAKAFNFSKTQHESVNRANILKAIEWGAPFVLYWEMYNNEIVNEIQQGLWLIDDKNEKWPLYYTFSNFYEDAKVWVSTQKEELNRLPTREEYLNWAVPRLQNP
ncbi:MAG: IPT/TIG domain-containing protein [Bacteroidales bacterium]|nr:IPT/TIG domain-containing protein [Bacteroidales bacterium]MCF8405356.1 IPT/TIG domain-containing protein [Bacteroidales bacterium]